ncbi:MAG: DinB family protein [Saprospiraceae bacterium]
MNHRPNANEYAPYYHTYIGKVPEGKLIQLLSTQIENTLTTFARISEEKGAYRYAEGKWSIKEVLGHIIDTERIMVFRALAIGRGDKTPIPGFEQDDYVATSNADARTIAEMVEELKLVRQSTIALFQSFTDEMMQELGTASGLPVSTRALAYIIVGHELHHLGILKERYL